MRSPHVRPRTPLRRPSIPRLVAASGVVALAGAGLAACEDDDSAGPESSVTAEDLQRLETRIARLEQDFGFFADRLEPQEDAPIGELEEPELLGQTVTISGEVTSVIDDHGFVLEGDEDLDPTESGPLPTEGILVVTTDAAGIGQGDVVQVVGVVAQYDTATFQDELDIELDAARYDTFEGEVALRADSITTDVPTGDE